MYRFFQITKLILFLYLISYSVNGQNYQFKIITEAENCDLGSASVEVIGAVANDSISTQWSSGEYNFITVRNLMKGSYSVKVKVKHRKDSIVQITDTTLYFNVEKGFCPISVSKYFTPNDDGINDLLQIGNVTKHPDFEFQVYNKWGQRVHSQKNTYTPWDGKWLGVDLPDGSYFYVFFYDGNKKALEKGDITIIR